MSRSFYVVFVTAPNADVGANIARAIVEERLAACVNIVDGCRSVYRWEGRVEDESEVMLVIKTAASTYDRLESRLQELHPYDVPEIIAVAPERISEPYTRFLEDNIAQ